MDWTKELDKLKTFWTISLEVPELGRSTEENEKVQVINEGETFVGEI